MRTMRERNSGRRIKIDRVTCACLATFMVLGAGYTWLRGAAPRPHEGIDYIYDGTEQEVSLDVAVSGDEEGRDTDSKDEESHGGIPDIDTDAGGMTVAAKSAILMDAATGTVLFAQNEHEMLPPASVTKVMTMLLVLEAVDSGRITLEDKVTISANAASMGGSQMYMEQGEQHTVEELMKGIAMVSANDGCVAMAEHISGSVDIFVENMNKRANELGLENTHFVNTNGLPADNHYSSAYDIAVMSRELMKHMEGKEWFTTWQDTMNVGLPGKQTEFGLTNTNKLIKQYPGVIGIKTGYTSDAGYCLSGAAEREGTKLIAVVLGCETSDIRLQEISKILDYGFANYETAHIAEKGEVIKELTFERGTPMTTGAITTEDVSLLVQKGQGQNISTKTVIDENIKLPVNEGDKVGELIVKHGDEEIARYDLTASETVKKAGIFEICSRLIDKLRN